MWKAIRFDPSIALRTLPVDAINTHPMLNAERLLWRQVGGCAARSCVPLVGTSRSKWQMFGTSLPRIFRSTLPGSRSPHSTPRESAERPENFLRLRSATKMGLTAGSPSSSPSRTPPCLLRLSASWRAGQNRIISIRLGGVPSH
jgi:hypothetical protein